MSVEPSQSGRDSLGRDLTVSITIGTDGRLHFHDLTDDLLPVAAALCPGSADLQRRLTAAHSLRTIIYDTDSGQAQQQQAAR